MTKCAKSIQMWSRHKFLNMMIYKNDTKCRGMPVAATETEMEMISKEEIGKEKTNKPFSLTLLTTFSTELAPAYHVEQWSSCKYRV